MTPEQKASVDKALAAANISRANQMPATHVDEATKPVDLSPPKSVHQIGADLHRAGVTMDK